MLVDILNEQARLGHDVSLVVINNSYTESVLAKISPKVKRVMLNRNPASCSLAIVARLNILLWKLKPNAIHLHHNSITRMLWLLRPGYLTVHALEISLSTSCKKLVELFAISDAVKEDIETRYPGVYLVKTIPNGIRMDNIVRKQEYGLNGGRMRVVQVARLDYDKKGQDLLIKALRLLKERGIDGITVDFIGDGSKRQDLEQMARDEDVEELVRFLGLRDREAIYFSLNQYDLMCHPSRYEGFGLTVAEGIAAGLPVLVPDSDGPYEIIQCGKLGYTFRKGDAQSLADALFDIYEHYMERAERVVDAAFEHVKANYSLNYMVEQYIKEYQYHIR